jgi:hypothetical protein
VIGAVSSPVLVGGSFTISGRGFTKGSVVNFFVATAKGPVNEGPLRASAISATQLTVPVSAKLSQSDGSPSSGPRARRWAQRSCRR